jgi:hypothetical protein
MKLAFSSFDGSDGCDVIDVSGAGVPLATAEVVVLPALSTARATTSKVALVGRPGQSSAYAGAVVLVPISVAGVHGDGVQ